MIYRLLLFCAMCLLMMPAAAQDDALNLPADLYVLLNEGTIQRYGQGTEGLSVVSPEGEFVVDFGIAPDGNWLAYRTQDGLYRVNMRGGEPLLVDENASFPAVRGVGDTIVWSPQADAIAYTTLGGARVSLRTDTGDIGTFIVELREGVFSSLSWSPSGRYLAAEAEGHIWWIYRREGNTISLSSALPSSFGIAWADGSELYFAPQEGNLVLMNLDNQNSQTAITSGDERYHLPYKLEDGTVLAFIETELVSAEATAEAAAAANAEPVPDDDALYGIFVRKAVSPAPAQVVNETPIDLTGLRWSPGGELLAGIENGVLNLVRPETGARFQLPVNGVAYSWLPPLGEQITGLAVYHDLYFIAADGNNIAQVWRLPADGSPAQTVTASPRDVTGYALSNDGQTLAYSSLSRLWTIPLIPDVPPVPVQLAELFADRDAQPDFSADNATVAYTDGGIWIVGAVGGSPLSIAPDIRGADNLTTLRSYSNPRFAPFNSSLLLVDIVTDGNTTLGILNIQGGQVTELTDGQRFGDWMTDGRIFSYGAGLNITSETAPAQSAQILPPTTAIFDAVETEPERFQLALPAHNFQPPVLRVVDVTISSGIQGTVASGIFLSNPVLSPDGNFVAGYNYVETTDSVSRGTLALYDLMTGGQYTLQQLGPVTNVQWSPV